MFTNINIQVSHTFAIIELISPLGPTLANTFPVHFEKNWFVELEYGFFELVVILFHLR